MTILLRTKSVKLAPGGEDIRKLTDRIRQIDTWLPGFRIRAVGDSLEIMLDDGAWDLFVPTSSGTTGGTGSAGAGNQYIEMEVDGVVYKVLHDGTV